MSIYTAENSQREVRELARQVGHHLASHLDLRSFVRAWPYEMSNIVRFWPYSSSSVKGRENPRIALLDTGIDTKHPSFAGARLVARGFPGHTDTVDEIGHGTHCAAILVSQQSSGMTGLVPRAVLFSAKVISRTQRSRSCCEESIVQALKWAIEARVQIILITFGWRSSSSRQIRACIDSALDRGITVISVAGNHEGSLPMFPASIHGVVCVSALGRNGLPLPECYQGDLVDVFAPGEEIMSALPNGWGRMSGSSQAASIFCGLYAQQLENYGREE